MKPLLKPRAMAVNNEEVLIGKLKAIDERQRGN
jgi:hypothetical protein